MYMVQNSGVIFQNSSKFWKLLLSLERRHKPACPDASSSTGWKMFVERLIYTCWKSGLELLRPSQVLFTTKYLQVCSH